MKVLLIYPMPTPESPQRTPPLSILYPGAYIARRGHSVRYFDERWDNDLESNLAWAEVVGVSAMSGYQLGRALAMLRQAHGAGKTTIIGGVHPTIAPEMCVSEPYIDYAVVGDGEETLFDLLQNIGDSRDVLGVWSKAGFAGNRPTVPGDEIESPVDAQTLRYFALSSKTDDVMLPASRGCMGRCGFCYNSAKPDGGKWRPVPVHKWASDLDELRRAGIHISFMQIGDDWLGPRGRIAEVGQVLADRGIRWHLSIRANQMDDALAKTLETLHCEGVSIGAESGSNEILQLMRKGISVSDTIKAAETLSHYAIKPLYYFILGIPTETDAQMHETMDLADRLNVIHQGKCSIAFFGFDPLMGTDLYRLAERIGYPVPRTLEECCTRERSNTHNARLNAIYYIAGLRFHRTKGDKTDRNFPGMRRLLILPFELLCLWRWKHRKFGWFGLERRGIHYLISKLRAKTKGER